MKFKLYYYYANYALKTEVIVLPDTLKFKKNIFIYFDYEREFGGHETDISDDDIDQLLEILHKYQFKTTWFTVGKIFENYPNSIKAIINHGHEIASHTYAHIPPLKMKKNKAKSDFELFSNCSSKFIQVEGFHSPMGRWSLNTLKHLWKNGYIYDVAGDSKKNSGFPFYILPCKKNKIIRMRTMGDDWPLFVENYTENEVFEYLIQLTNKINNGEISGIGFHPWVLYSNQQIFNGFRGFLEYLNNNKEFQIKTANCFVKDIIND